MVIYILLMTKELCNILQAAVSQVRFKPRLAQLAIDSLLTVLKEEPIVAHTVGEFMWGYDDPLLKIAKNLLPPEERMPFDKFGFFINVSILLYLLLFLITDNLFTYL